MRVHEGAKDRRLRLIILAGVVICVIIAFYYQSLKFTQPYQAKNKVADFEQMVSVIKPATETENPLVAVVKMHDNMPILILYEINISDQYKFETINVAELKQQPEEIVSNGPNGIWIKLNGEWFSFDMDLEFRGKNDDEVIVMQKPVKYTVDEDQTVIVTTSDNEELWSQQFSEKPISIQTLSLDERLWLVVFKDDIVIYEN